MRFTSPALVVALAAGLVSVPQAPAAPPPAENDLVTKVNGSINRGTQFLFNSMRDGKDWEGYWQYSVAKMEGGITALATLALLNCGEKPDELHVAAALNSMRAMQPRATYTVALMTMAFAEARQDRDLPLIQKHVDWLLGAAIRKQGRIVGWSYWNKDSENGPMGPNGDSSNTQYALLGLYAGKQAGAKIPDADWESLYELYIKRQTVQNDGTGAWSYTPEPNFDRPSFTMTTAGVSGLVISSLGRAKSAQGLNPATGVAANCGRYPEDEAMTRGLNYIGKYFTFERPRNGQSTFYNVYGIERVGRLSGRRFLGTIDWYREGCEYLAKEQKKNGSWSQSGKDAEDYDSSAVIATSFSLLFLSKGRTPILVSKLAWGDLRTENGVFVEGGPEPGVVGWNRKHHDLRHLTEYAGRELFKNLPMGWQVYDPRRRELATKEDINAEVGVLVQSPVLFINGHTAPRLTGQQEELLKRYVEEGGFVFAEACCGSPEFTAGYRDLIRKLFPETPLRPVPPEHPVWSSYFAVPPTAFPQLECLDRGCRTVMVLSPEPLAGYWDEAKYMPKPGKGDTDRGGEAYRLGANVIAYATGLEPPQQRGTVRKIASDDKADRSPPNGFLKPAQLKLLNEPAPAPAAMRNLMAHARVAAKLDVVLAPELVTADNPELFKFKFLYLHGRKRFSFTPAEQEGLRATLQSGGLLLADAACGSAAFDEAFRAEINKVIPGAKLVPIPLDDALYTKEFAGAKITTVKRREKAGGAAGDAGFQDLPPLLEGIKVDGRWAVVYSKYDIGCSLEGHRSTDCLGHTRESALRLATAAVVYMLKQ